MNIYAPVFLLMHLNIILVFSQITGEGLLPKKCGIPMSCHPFFGVPTIPANAYPWIAGILYEIKASKNGESRVEQRCSGTLINNRYVLTGAHCFASVPRPSLVRLGEWDLRTDEDCITTAYGQKQCLPRPIVTGIEDAIIHPAYSDNANDIALIRLNISIDQNSADGLNPICLPPSDFIFKYAAFDKRSFAAGWGVELEKSSHELRPILRSVALPLADEKRCRDIYKETFVESKQLCVGGIGEDTCYGDGGGPLILPGPSNSSYIQVGIVSYGLDCGRHPSGYTSVAAYRNWIVENLKP